MTKCYLEAFRQGLKKLGYVEGKISLWSTDSGKTDQLPKLAAELVTFMWISFWQMVSPAGAAKQATSKIPIVMTSCSDPVGLDLSPALPGLVETSRDCRPIAVIWVENG